MHETSIDWLGFKSCPGRAVPKSYVILNRLEYSQLSSLSPCGHPGAADARYYGQNPDPRQKLQGFDWNYDSRYLSLSLLRNYGHFGGTKW